jgi:hypothetical protein
VSVRAALLLFVVFAAGWVPALVGREAVARAADLFALADEPNPYFVPRHATTLYLLAPLVVTSASLLLLAPGLFLALALNGGRSVGHWLAYGFALSLVVVSAAAAGVQSAVGAPLRGGAFAWTVVGCSAVCLGLLVLRARHGRVLFWPFRGTLAGHQLLSAVLVPGLLLVALTPKVYWENFNGDGAHAFESGRLLLHQPLPFWPEAAGDIASFPGVNSALFCYPTSWYIRLFGEVEAAARLPYFLFLPALYGALIALIGSGRARPLGLAETWLAWVPLALFTVVMAFSAAYSPYNADLALPGAEYALLMACFFGTALASLEGQKGWTALFIFLTLVVAPNGLQLILLWVAALALLGSPRPWRAVVTCLLCVAGSVAFLTAAARAMPLLGLPAPGQEHSLANLLKHLAFLRFNGWHRLAYLVVPCGILPASALLAWRWLDRPARMFALMAVVYFGFFYVQAYGALHYFAPAMLLPVVAFWRSRLVLDSRLRTPAVVGVCLGGVLALGLSLPASAALYTAARPVGRAVEDRTSGYEVAAAPALKRLELLGKLFPDDAQPEVPDRSYGDSPLVWNYYAHRRPARPGAVNYVVQAAAAPVPSGARVLAEYEGTVLYVNDPSEWVRQQGLHPATPPGSRTYHIPRSTLIRGLGPQNEPGVIRLEEVLGRLGLNTERLKAWLIPPAP